MIVQRYDKSRLSSVKRLDNGYLIAPGNITRTGVFVYSDGDGGTVRELRLPEEVFSDQAMESFGLSPLTNDHPTEALTSGNTGNFQVGTVTNIHKDDTHVASTIQITDDKAIQDVESGKQELSCGYSAKLEYVDGITKNIPGIPDGLKYDAIQRNIRGNHVAIVDAGRAGPSAALRLDSINAAIEPLTTGAERQEIDLMQIKIDNLDIEVTESAAHAVQSAITKRDKRLEDAEKWSKEVKADLAKEKARADKAEEDLVEAKKIDVDKLVKDRLELERSADKVLGNEYVASGKTDAEIMADVVIKTAPQAAEKLDGCESAYLQARYDQAMESFTDPSSITNLRKITDGEEHKDARAEMIKRMQNAWRVS